MMIHRFHKYLFWRKKTPYIPRQLINPYILREATEDELLLMMMGYARSPDAARLLLTRSAADSAGEFMRRFPKRRPSFLRRRFIALIQWAEGHYRGSAFRNLSNQSEVYVRYKYEDKK